MSKPKSRSQRWADAVTAAKTALDELQCVQMEYQEWRDNLPENLESSTLGEKLDAVCDLDIEGRRVDARRGRECGPTARVRT